MTLHNELRHYAHIDYVKDFDTKVGYYTVRIYNLDDTKYEELMKNGEVLYIKKIKK